MLVSLTACTTTPYRSSGEKLYKAGPNGPQLQVLPPLERSNLSDFYNLPNQSENPSVSILPPSPHVKPQQGKN